MNPYTEQIGGATNRTTIWAVLLFALIAVFSLTFVNSPGTGDVGIWTTWIKNAHEYGVVQGYPADKGDYPPISIFMLFASSKISAMFGGDIFAGIKWSLVLFLFLTSAAIYAYTRNLVLTACVHLALTLNSVALGYLDAYFTPTFVLAMLMLSRRKFTAFSILYTISFMIKWQSVLLLPFMCIHLLEINSFASIRTANWRRFLMQVVLPSAVIVGILFSIYGVEIARAFVRAMSHRYPSANALNLNWIVTYVLHLVAPEQYAPLNDGLARYISKAGPVITWVSRALFGASYLAALWLAVRRQKTFENLMVTALLGFLSYFTFNIGVHENHLYLAGIVAILIYLANSRYAVISAFVVLFTNINLYLFYGIDGNGPPFSRAVGVLDSAVLLSAVWVVFMLAFMWQEIRKPLGNPGTVAATGEANG